MDNDYTERDDNDEYDAAEAFVDDVNHELLRRYGINWSDCTSLEELASAHRVGQAPEKFVAELDLGRRLGLQELKDIPPRS